MYIVFLVRGKGFHFFGFALRVFVFTSQNGDNQNNAGLILLSSGHQVIFSGHFSGLIIFARTNSEPNGKQACKHRCPRL